MPPADLSAQARDFAEEVTTLLNATITDGVTFSAVAGRRSGTLVLGGGVTKAELGSQAVPLTLGRQAPSAWLRVAFILGRDPEGEYLTVLKSGFALYADADRDRMMLHYDYEREPAHSYPPAHVQVQGAAKDLSALAAGRSGQRKELKDFHLPVGGRLYRPTIEDVIEFIVAEDLADARPAWPTPSATPAADGRTVSSEPLCGATRIAPSTSSVATESFPRRTDQTAT